MIKAIERKDLIEIFEKLKKNKEVEANYLLEMPTQANFEKYAVLANLCNKVESILRVPENLYFEAVEHRLEQLSVRYCEHSLDIIESKVAEEMTLTIFKLYPLQFIIEKNKKA